MTKASAVIAPPSNSSTKDETRSIDVPGVRRIAILKTKGGAVIDWTTPVPQE